MLLEISNRSDTHFIIINYIYNPILYSRAFQLYTAAL